MKMIENGNKPVWITRKVTPMGSAIYTAWEKYENENLSGDANIIDNGEGVKMVRVGSCCDLSKVPEDIFPWGSVERSIAVDELLVVEHLRAYDAIFAKYPEIDKQPITNVKYVKGNIIVKNEIKA